MDVAAPRRTGFPTEDGRDSLVNAQADIGLRIRGNVQHSRTQKNIRGKLYGVVLFPIDDAGGGSGKLAEDLRDDLPPYCIFVFGCADPCKVVGKIGNNRFHVVFAVMLVHEKTGQLLSVEALSISALRLMTFSLTAVTPLHPKGFLHMRHTGRQKYIIPRTCFPVNQVRKGAWALSPEYFFLDRIEEKEHHSTDGIREFFVFRLLFDNPLL